eukprot:CAMPEP_0204492926 /NCGR_PEP_ID=MMETSP0471-20130131/80864_1 /ASSEMBLY_ACC=CAM_ASM_000602 /TAXON_ID=2969 /ORGANISM="Oxyrrhis marina" /LENGTH=41 /DNA_ID= /DNA_START= /DNA_END= /DNA_ORIENTATION=
MSSETSGWPSRNGHNDARQHSRWIGATAESPRRRRLHQAGA